MALGLFLALCALILFGPLGLVLVLFVASIVGFAAWMFK